MGVASHQRSYLLWVSSTVSLWSVDIRWRYLRTSFGVNPSKHIKFRFEWSEGIRYVITLETDIHQLGYSITMVADSLAPGHQRTPCWLEYGCMAWHRYVVSTAIRQAILERSGKVRNPLVSLLLVTFPSDGDKAQCDDDHLSMKTRFRNKIESLIKASLQWLMRSWKSLFSMLVSNDFINVYMTGKICIWICLAQIALH